MFSHLDPLIDCTSGFCHDGMESRDSNFKPLSLKIHIESGVDMYLGNMSMFIAVKEA